MATGVDANPQDGSINYFPVLHEGRSSLVSISTPRSHQVPTPRERATEWAAEVRRNISLCVERHEDVKEEDITRLKQALVLVFINTLQLNSRDAWAYLCEVLQLLEGYREYLKVFETTAELHHYLERIMQQVHIHRERLFDLQVEQHLSRVFPQKIECLKQLEVSPLKKFGPVVTDKSANNSKRPKSSRKSSLLMLPDGTYPYSAHVLSDKQILGTHDLTFGDLRHSLGNVAFETAARESVWNSCLGTTALALSTNIPEEAKGLPKTEDTEYQTLTKRDLVKAKPIPWKDHVVELPLMNGREAVQYFASCKHTGKIQSLYFNLAQSRHFAPYDLISVPKTKINPEHYVFSSFGVLHVYPDQPAESMTLAQWQRRAVLWKAIAAIPFFKNYLVRKAFNRWRSIKLYLDYQRKQILISENLLHNVPAFGAGLLQVSRLLKELITVQFLPFETDKTYQLAEYENNINYKKIQAEHWLEKFFRYCKVVVDTIAEESFIKLKYCEEQVRKKRFFSKDSLHLQRMKKEERERNLKKAQKETGRLGNFVKLVDQMVVEHLFHITKTQVLAFVDNVLAIGSQAPRDGFFKANLVFNKQDVLALSPSKQRFELTLNSTLQGIPAVLCSKAIYMDGSVNDSQGRDSSQELNQETKTSASQSNMDLKSTTACRPSSPKYDKRLKTKVSSESQVWEGTADSSLTEQEDQTVPSLSSGRLAGDNFPVPCIPKSVTLTKKEDDLGVATPDLVLTERNKSLAVEGEGFLGQYSPLSHANLEDKLARDGEYQAALKVQRRVMRAALDEIDNYCEYNQWLNAIHVFCCQWNDKSVREFRGMAAFTIEQKLTELRQWSEKVRNFDRNFTSENGLFFVDCSAIHEGLLPRLSDIYQELLTFVADEAKSMAASFVDEMNIVAKNMKDKEEDVESFAEFAKNYQLYKKNTLQYQQRVDYIKSLYEVIRMSSRQLTAEEEKVEERVWTTWEAFLMQMQDAGEFINTQTPLMAQQLETTFQTLERDARLLAEQATTGQFLDPSQPPLQILSTMKELREKFFRTQLQLQEASQWRETIVGERYNLKFLNEMTVSMDVRQELWKYVEVSQHVIKDWKQLLFKKVNIKKALEKVTEWQSAAAQLKPHLPAGDAVLTAWCHSLQDFQKELPVLHKLANDALKDRHWQSIFLGINEPYMGSAEFTVEELISYKLCDSADLVRSVYLSALAEYDLEQTMSQIKRLWQDKEFKLAKYIPDSLYVKAPGNQATSSGHQLTKLEQYRQERVAAAAGVVQRLDLASDDFFVLIEVEELKYHLEDSRISVEAMLQSPYVGDIQNEAKEWSSALREIEEITDLWSVCHKKWTYLLKIFEQPEMYRRLSQQAFKFESVHNKFKDWMRVVSSDSKILSVVNRRRGEKGYRLLQGENLRSLLLSLIQQQEEILKELEQHLEHYRTQFPRLYFLSNGDLVDMLGISRNPRAFVPFVRKCFPGISNLTFSLPPGTGGLNSALDFAINSEKLQVVSVQGLHGEEVGLYTALDAHPVASVWLRRLESILKNTMTVVLQACVQAHMEEGTRQPILILEELSRLSQLPRDVADLTMEIRHKYCHWLLQFPAQCVLTADCILWERGTARALEKTDPEELKVQKSNLSARIDQYVNVLREASLLKDLDDDVRERLHCLLSSLITQNIHHRDIMDALLKEGVVSDSSFEWLRVLKFHMDIRNVLRAKTTQISEVAKQTPISTASTGSSSLPASRIKGQAEDIPPALTRTKTTVSTDLQFSPCCVQQLTNSFFYDYEYLGPSLSLVVTPLTERTILSLTQSLKNFHCSALMGPSGVGKTETIRHLAKVLGRCMFTVVCTESMNLPMMLQFMTGMVQSGCWMLFDDIHHLSKGLMSVAAQQLDYLHTALRALDPSTQSQYLIRGQPRFDKMLSLKAGTGDKVIRRNSLTTLHPLPKSEESQESPVLERQRTVPHGFNEKGLVTYFEDTWVAERDQRRHSIEREIEIKESELYKNNRPPPLFYEHVKLTRRRVAPDYSKLVTEPMYVHHIVGSVMFSGRLIAASANFGCFMTMGMSGANPINMPDNFRILLRPCALIKPETHHILSVYLQVYGFQHQQLWARKLTLFFRLLKTKLPRVAYYQVPLQDVKKVVMVASSKLQDLSGTLTTETSKMEQSMSRLKMEPQSREEQGLVWALRQILTSRIREEDEPRFIGLLHDVFPQAANNLLKMEDGVKEDPLEVAIKEVIKEDNLLYSEQLMQKVLQLNAALTAQSPVVLTGPVGSGKSTTCHILSRAINLLNYKLFAPDHSSDDLTTDWNSIFPITQKVKDIDEDLKPEPSTGLKKLRQLRQNSTVTKTAQSLAEEQHKTLLAKEVAEYPKVDVIRIVPTTMEPKKLLGEVRDGVWQGGLFGKIAQDSFFMWLANKTYMDSLPNSERRDKKQQSDLPSVLLRWLILDGNLDPLWTEGIKSMFDEERCLTLPCGERINLKDTTSLIFETNSLFNASPSAVSRCSVVHCGETTVHWSAHYHTWKQTAKARWILTDGSLQMLQDLIQDVFPPTLKFLNTDCCSALLTDTGVHSLAINTVVSGVMEVTSFLKIFSALLDRVLLREELEKKAKAECGEGMAGYGTTSRQLASGLMNMSNIESFIPNYISILKGMFAFSFVWAFGGHLHDRFKERFSHLAQDILYRAVHSVRMPASGLVFDHFVDESSGCFVRWSDKHQDKVKTIGGSYFVTPVVERYSYLLDLLVSNYHPVLLAGEPGVGKTSLMQHLVLPKHTSSTLVMSSGMTAARMQTSIISHILQLQSTARSRMPGPGAGRSSKQRHLFFIDDLSMAPAEGGYQPIVELLRSVLSSGGMYDDQRQVFQELQEATFIAAATVPTAPGSGLGQASQLLSSRLLRQFINVTVFSPDMNDLLTLYSRPLHVWLEEFPTNSVEHHYEFAQALTMGLLELYHLVRGRLRPTPVHAHYVFSLHDVARVVQGILLMSPRSHVHKMHTWKKTGSEGKNFGLSSSQDSIRRPSSSSQGGKLEPRVAAPLMKVIAQLWCHECMRNFADRLVTDEDRSWFTTVLEEQAVKHFCMPRVDPKTEMSVISEETTVSQGLPVSQADPFARASLDISMCSNNKNVTQTSKSLGNGQERIILPATVSQERNLNDSVMRSSTELKRPTSHSPSQDTSTTLSAASTSRSTADVKLEAGSEMDTRKARETSDPQSRTGTDIKESNDELESSESSSDESTSSEEMTSPTTTSGKKTVKSRQQLSEDSSKATSEVLDTDWDVTGLERKQDLHLQLRHSSQASGSYAGPSHSGSPLKHQSSHTSCAKRGVTFKTGLIADKEQEAYYGPLLAIEEIKGPLQNLTDLLFSKFFLTCHTETKGLPIEKGYTDSSEELLTEALQTCLTQYNEGTSQRLELVFFSEAVRHSARLSRVLAHPQGHALLLGMSYCTGRATLTRLAAYIAHCKLFEPKPQADAIRNYDVVCEHMKRSCHYAGVVGKPTVLLVHEDLGDQFLPDVAVLMATGTSPGLYAEEEVQTIVEHMMPGGVQTKRVDKIEQAFERFAKRVRQNLHIVVCLNYKGNSYSSDFRSLYDKLQRCPGLVKNAFSIDLYQPWGFNAFSTVAQAWLEDHKSHIKIPWNLSKRSEQVKMASDAMAYVHLSAKAAVERQYCHQKEPLRFYSPLTFLEFVHLFRIIAAYIGKIERAKAHKYERALGKINEAFGSIAEFCHEVSDLTPKHKAATESVQTLVEFVEQQKKQYIDALDQCKMQEESIVQLQEPLDKLRKSAQSEFDKVNPVYLAAQSALNSLHVSDIEELKSYPSPPKPVKLLTNALCLMMAKPQTWEDARAMMINEEFLENLIFYDKDHIPEKIYEDLKYFVNHPQFQVDSMRSVSKPAAAMCQWVIAIHQYSTIYRKMQPHLKSLQEAESKFTKAQAQLGQLRVEAHCIKTALENTIGKHKEALREAKSIEKVIQGIERKIARANNLMENMSMQHFLWRSELRKARRHLLAAPGDALVTAACVCYHGPLDDKSRLELITDWLDRCRQGTFHAQAFLDRDPYSMIAWLELLMESSSHSGHKGSDDAESDIASRSGETVHSEVSSALQSTPQVRTFKYMPAIYDTGKFYKSELKKTDTMESIQPSTDIEDSDDEEDLSSLPTRSNYTLQDILSDFDELSEWRMHSLPTDLHAVQNALIMRITCHNRRHCWPLLLDPDNQAEMWVKALQTSRNIFTAKDLSGSEEDEGIPIDKVKQLRDIEPSELPEPPPSRGTGLTFSDVTEYTIPEVDYTIIPNVKNSEKWQSHETGENEELRPVTSVTNSWETLSLHANSSIERPESTLWIVEADDQALNGKLLRAIVHGVTVLVTHLERRPLGALFRGLLLKQFYVDHDGSKVVRVGNMHFILHPSFCLYLSTTVPLFLKGDGLHSFPIHHMSIINMAVSDEAIMNRLLFETMKVERKEFEGQRRSNESDIILHRQRLAQEHEAIREKTLNLDVPLLEDRTMLESLMACQSNVQRNRLILEETRFMGNHLQDKFAQYLPLMMEATVLYNMLRRMTVLHPMYYLPFYKFVDIFTAVIKSRDRGKGSLGAPQSRAQELSNAVTSSVFHHMNMMLFELHYKLFALLVSLEHLRLSRKASNKELSLFVNGFEKHGLDEGLMLEQKPAWMDKKAWIDCSILENLHHPLHGLCKSLVAYSEQWNEYFQHPVSLLNPVPGITLQELSIFQKCLLWKFCCPERMAELAQAIVTFELGSAVSKVDHYNIREVYQSADQFTPVIFVLPTELQGPPWEATQGQPYISPVHEVKRLARETGMEGKMRIINFGVKSQGCEIRQAMDDCIHNGNWLLLQNYHLSDQPDPSFFTMLKDLVYARWSAEDLHCESSDNSEDSHSLVTHSRPSTHIQCSPIHPTFRLWITTRANCQRIIPGILIQHGMKVTCEATGNFHSTLQKCYRSSAYLFRKWHSVDQESVSRMDCVMPLALLHALLIQQSYFGCFAFVHPHYWILSDLAMAVEAFHLLVQPTQSYDATALVASIYSHHCADSTDATVVQAIAQDLASLAAHPKQDGRENCRVAYLLRQLIQAGEERHSLSRTLDTIEDTSARMFSLPAEAQNELMACHSRIMLGDLIQVTGAPELLLQSKPTPSVVMVEPQVLIPQLLALLTSADSTNFQLSRTQQIMPLDDFFCMELQEYHTLLDQIQSDLILLQRSIHGEIILTQDLQTILDTVLADEIPAAWMKCTFTPCRSLRQWLESVNKKVLYVKECFYVRPLMLWLSAFLRPDQLFPAIMQTYAKHFFKDVAHVKLTFEVMPVDFEATEAPSDGLYIHGLLLVNAGWDSKHSALMELLPGDQAQQPLPPVWIRPLCVMNDSHCYQDTANLYKCPLFSCSESELQQDNSLITRIPLRTLQPPVLWTQKRVLLALNNMKSLYET